MEKKSTKQIGDAGEDLAADLLQRKGYKIIERNFRTRFGELDIVAKDGKVLVFVEVKAKASDRFGAPAEMINARKQQKIKNMALTYINEKNFEGPWRVDAVLIQGDLIELLKNITL